MKQGTLTVLTRITPASPEQLEQLRSTLGQLQQASEFLQPIPGLHFARWALLDRGPLPGASEGSPGEDPGGVFLVFGADFESERRRPGQLREGFISDLVDALVAQREQPAARAFEDLYRQCSGYPGSGLDDPEAVKGWLLAHVLECGVRHVAYAYRACTAAGLKRGLAMRREVDRWLDRDSLARSAGSPEERYRRLREHVHAQYPELFSEEARERRKAARRAALWATVAYAPIDALATLVRFGHDLLLQVRRRALRSRPGRPVSAAARARLALESEGGVQNPLVLLSTLKCGWLRRALLRWLLMPTLRLRFLRYLEGLNHITSIHFARWVLFRDGERHRLLFFTNFDGSLNSYLDSFLDNPDVRMFLTLIWGVTEGFPGVQDPDAFKAWVYTQSRPVGVWHSAYRDTGAQSTVDIHNAYKLQELFEQGYASPEVRALLTTGVCVPETKTLSVLKAISGLLSLGTRERKSDVAERQTAGPEGGPHPRQSRPFRAPRPAPEAHRERRVRRRPGAGVQRIRTPDQRLLPAPGDREP